jgi:hypothetical protein
MSEKHFGAWEVVGRKTNNWLLHLIGIAFQAISFAEPITFSSVTWSLRHIETGETRKVTARSEAQAAARVAAGDFDA